MFIRQTLLRLVLDVIEVHTNIEDLDLDGLDNE